MFLSAFGASKPSGGDPFFSSVIFFQNFNSLAVGSQPYPLLSQKSGGQMEDQNNFNVLTIQSSPSISGNSAQNNGGANGTQPLYLYYIPGGLTAWTVECSVYRNSSDAIPFNILLNIDAGYFTVYNGFIHFQIGGLVSTGVLFQNFTWYDLALTKTGNTLRIFVNGVLTNTITTSGVMVQFFGPSEEGTGILNWFIDELRISSVCRYTASYTPVHPFPLA